jgi:hypothetical protein
MIVLPITIHKVPAFTARDGETRMIEKIWGQEIEDLDQFTYRTHIRRAVWRVGLPVKVGINQKIVNVLNKKCPNGYLVISCDDPKVEFSVPILNLKKGEEFHDHSVPSGDMPMRLIEIPRESYKR